MDTVKTVESPYNNAVAVINRTNELLNENNIKDSTGNQIAQLEITPANPAWLFALGCGSLHTSWQEKLAKAYACLDPQNCEEEQVLVLASLAGLTRGNGKPTHITVRIVNSDSSEITVPIGTTFTETFVNQTWVLNKPLTIAGNAYVYATLYTTVDGEYSVPSGVTFNYEGDLPIVCTSSSSSAGGENIETIASLRNRLSQGVETSDPLVQAMTAIALLSGIESCTIWFNRNVTGDITIGNITLSPREAYVSIKGYDYSGKVAETYYQYLDVPATIGEQEETILKGQQEIALNFDYAQEALVDVYVKYNSSDAAVGIQGAIKDAILAHSGTLSCGQNVTAQMISEWVQNLGYGTILGCAVGTATGIRSSINPDEFVVFDKDHISVDAL